MDESCDYTYKWSELARNWSQCGAKKSSQLDCRVIRTPDFCYRSKPYSSKYGPNILWMLSKCPESDNCENASYCRAVEITFYHKNIRHRHISQKSHVYKCRPETFKCHKICNGTARVLEYINIALETPSVQPPSQCQH